MSPKLTTLKHAIIYVKDGQLQIAMFNSLKEREDYYLKHFNGQPHQTIRCRVDSMEVNFYGGF